MPRKVTVTLADGRQVVYGNVPYSVSPAQMTARIQSDYGQRAQTVDGGGPPKPNTADFYEHRWANVDPSQAKVLVQRYAAVAAHQGQSAAAFAQDPRVQGLMRVAGMSGVPTPAAAAPKPAAPKPNVAAVATAAAKGEQGGDFLSAVKGGLTRGIPGFEQATAGLASILPESITGIHGSPGYSNILQALRARTDAEMARAPTTGTVANLAGNVVGLGAAGGAVKGAIGKLAATGDGVAGSVGNFLQRATVATTPTVGKGLSIAQKAGNAGKILATGAAAGATTAASEGGDVKTGAVAGAAGAGVAGTAGKLISVAAQPVKAILGLSTAPQILSKFTSVTKDAMQAAADRYKAVTGAEPTLFELLPAADRNSLMKGVVAGKDPIVDQATKAIAARAKTLGPDMAAKVANVVEPQRAAIKDKIVGDLAAARGVEPAALAPEDHDLVDRAMTNSTDMDALRKAEVQAHMAPHVDTPVVDNLHDLYPQIPGQEGGRPVAIDPEVNNLIKNSSGTIPLRPNNAGITGGDVSNIMQNLRGYLKGSDPGMAMTAQRGLDHLQGVLDEVAPDVGKASAAATDAYAARSRMMEGLDAGMDGDLRNSVQTGTSGKSARLVRNAFDTTEGKDGLALGQSNALMTDLSGDPRDALKATVDLSRGRTSRQLDQNLGSEAGGEIGAAAQAQDESAQALASASSKANAGTDTSGPTMANALIAMHPGSFVTTKAHALVKLAKMVVVPEAQARTITDMLFSQDPAMRGKAIDALSIVPGGQKALQAITGVAGGATGGALTAPAVGDPNDDSSPAPAPDDAPLPMADALPAADPAAPPTAPDPAAPPAGPSDPAQSPYLDHLSNVYSRENPDLLDLSDSIAHAESSGRHFNKDGSPKISRTGAVGLMQIEPSTAPDAARAAGLPLDMHALYHDPIYNKLLGIAQISTLLKHYDGDPTKATAAYNAGQGRVDHALANGGVDWVAHLPGETQNYIQKVG